MTMFIRAFDFDLVTRVWDIFLLEGDYKIVYRVSLAILKSCEKELMSRKFDKIMAFVRELPHRIDADAVMDLCWKIPLRRAHITACEQEVGYPHSHSFKCCVTALLPFIRGRAAITLATNFPSMPVCARCRSMPASNARGVRANANRRE